MSTKFHCSMSVRGVLHWDDDEWRENINIFSDENNQPMTIYQVKESFMDALKEGKEVIPISSECDNFDNEHGCQGHENEDIDNANQNAGNKS